MKSKSYIDTKIWENLYGRDMDEQEQIDEDIKELRDSYEQGKIWELNNQKPVNREEKWVNEMDIDKLVIKLNNQKPVKGRTMKTIINKLIKEIKGES